VRGPSYRVAMIHQPDFLPWLGFFHKFTQSDLFIVLDHVTNHPDCRNWIRRVKICVDGRERWLSLPLQKNNAQPFVPIRDLRVLRDCDQFKNKLLPLVCHAYRKSPFFSEVYPALERHFADDDVLLRRWNMRFIVDTAIRLEIPIPDVVSSSDFRVMATKTGMLVDLCKQANASAWLHTGGVSDYFDADGFDQSGLSRIEHRFTHPIYPQFNSREFLPGLSVIDALMNCGYSGVSRMIRTGAPA
jgi:hypothetical protein